jgi:hypothetical protein
MMTTYVLIFWIIAGTNRTALHSQEFFNPDSCREALLEMRKWDDRLTGFCTRK